MRAALIYLDIQFDHKGQSIGGQTYDGVGIVYSLISSCLECDFYHIVDDNSFEYLGEKLSSIPYTLVAISLFSQQFQIALKIIPYIDPGTKIIIGGPHTIVDPYSIMTKMRADCVVVGECDEFLVELIEDVIGNKELNKFPNLIYKNDNTIRQTEDKYVFKNIDKQIKIDYSIFSLHPAFVQKHGVQLTTSRGCPFRCNYCANSTFKEIFGNDYTVRLLKPEILLSSLEEIKSQIRTDRFVFSGDIFTLDAKWLRQFMKLYKQQINVPFECHTRAEFINKESVNLLKESGCDGCSLGIESCSDRIRKRLGRTDSMKNIISSINLLNNHNLHVQGYFMYAIPGEDWNDFTLTLEFLNKGMLDSGVFSVYSSFVKRNERYYSHDYLSLARNKNPENSLFKKSLDIYRLELEHTLGKERRLRLKGIEALN